MPYLLVRGAQPSRPSTAALQVFRLGSVRAQAVQPAMDVLLQACILRGMLQACPASDLQTSSCCLRLADLQLLVSE